MPDSQSSKGGLLQQLAALQRRIHELEQAQEKSKQSEKQFKELFENTPVGIYRTTPDGRIIMANPALIQMLGYSNFEELSQRNLEKEGFAPSYPRSAFKDLIKKEGKVVGLESAWIRRDGTTLFIIENARAVRDESGKTLYYEGIVQDITEHRRAKDVLAESERKFRQFVENLNGIAVRGGLEGKPEFLLGRLEEITGFSWEDFCSKGLTWFDLIYPDDRERLIEEGLKEARLGKPIIQEYRIIRKDGGIRWVSQSISPETKDDGTVQFVQGVITDITEQKAAEELLIQAKEYTDSLLEAIPESIVITDLNGRIQRVNSAFERGIGWKRGELIGNTTVELGIMSEEEGQRIRNVIIPKLINEGTVRDVEFIAIHKNGTKYHILMDWTLLKDAHGKPNNVITVSRNITERKKMEQVLRESQMWQRAILDSIPDMAWLKDKESKYIAANEALCKAFSIKFEDFVGKTDLDISPKDLAEKYRADDQEVIKSGRRKLAEEQWGKKEGKRIWIETIKTPIYNDQGQIIATSGIARDVTSRKKLERALMESEAKHRALIEQIPAITYTAAIDQAITTTYVSPQVERILGFSQTDYRNDPDIWRKQLHPDDRQRVLDELLRCHESGEPFTCEYRMLTRNGQTVWIRDEARIIMDDQGNPLHLQGVMYDITGHKKIEQSLKESEKRYRTLFDTSPVGVGLASIDGKVLAYNNALLNMTGYSEEEIRQINLKDTYVDPQERVNLIERLRTNGLVQNFEAQLKRKDDTTYWASLTISKFNQAGQDVLLTVAMDITERKKAEEKIRTLSSAVEQSIDGIAIGDLEPKLLYVNKTYAQMHNYTPEEMIGMPVANLHNEDQMNTFKARINQIKIQGFGTGEIEHVKKNGTAFPVYMSVTLLKDSNGQPTGILAVARDITERKKAEELLRTSEKKFKDLAETTTDWIWEVDKEGVYTYVSPKVKELLGYEVSEVLGKTPFDLMPEEEGKRISKIFKDKVVNKEPFYKLENINRHKNGHLVILETNGIPVFDEKGQFKGYRGIDRDITESKQREKEFNIYREKMAKAEQWASLGTLGASLAHELTQPLTVITLSIENALMEMEKTLHPEPVMNKLRDVLTEVSKVNTITRRFRDAARRTSERRISEVDLKAVAEKTINLFNDRAQQAKVRLVLRGFGNLPQIYSSEGDLGQIFFALVENAIQAADGKKDYQLVISAKVIDKHIEMQFSDNCGGIAPENLNKIFEPFFTTKSTGRSTGLGLCIVEHIVSRAGGKIQVESKLGEGTTFIVTLPIKRYAKL